MVCFRYLHEILSKVVSYKYDILCFLSLLSVVRARVQVCFMCMCVISFLTNDQFQKASCIYTFIQGAKF